MAAVADVSGEWTAGGGAFVQSSRDGKSRIVLKEKPGTDFTLSCRVRRTSFKDGVYVYFGLNGSGSRGHYYNVGGFTGDIVSHGVIGTGDVGRTERCVIETGRWYDVRLVVSLGHSELYVDGRLVAAHSPRTVPEMFVATGVDRQAGETVIKVVNRSPEARTVDIALEGAGGVASKGRVVVLAADSDTDENTLAEPMKISPQESAYDGFGRKFTYSFKPYSYTVLRVKAAPAAAGGR